MKITIPELNEDGVATITFVPSDSTGFTEDELNAFQESKKKYNASFNDIGNGTKTANTKATGLPVSRLILNADKSEISSEEKKRFLMAKAMRYGDAKKAETSPEYLAQASSSFLIIPAQDSGFTREEKEYFMDALAQRLLFTMDSNKEAIKEASAVYKAVINIRRESPKSDFTAEEEKYFESAFGKAVVAAKNFKDKGKPNWQQFQSEFSRVANNENERIRAAAEQKKMREEIAKKEQENINKKEALLNIFITQAAEQFVAAKKDSQSLSKTSSDISSQVASFDEFSTKAQGERTKAKDAITSLKSEVEELLEVPSDEAEQTTELKIAAVSKRIEEIEQKVAAATKGVEANNTEVFKLKQLAKSVVKESEKILSEANKELEGVKQAQAKLVEITAEFKKSLKEARFGDEEIGGILLTEKWLKLIDDSGLFKDITEPITIKALSGAMDGIVDNAQKNFNAAKTNFNLLQSRLAKDFEGVSPKGIDINTVDLSQQLVVLRAQNEREKQQKLQEQQELQKKPEIVSVRQEVEVPTGSGQEDDGSISVSVKTQDEHVGVAIKRQGGVPSGRNGEAIIGSAMLQNAEGNILHSLAGQDLYMFSKILNDVSQFDNREAMKRDLHNNDAFKDLASKYSDASKGMFVGAGSDGKGGHVIQAAALGGFDIEKEPIEISITLGKGENARSFAWLMPQEELYTVDKDGNKVGEPMKFEAAQKALGGKIFLPENKDVVQQTEFRGLVVQNTQSIPEKPQVEPKENALSDIKNTSAVVLGDSLDTSTQRTSTTPKGLSDIKAMNAQGSKNAIEIKTAVVDSITSRSK